MAPWLMLIATTCFWATSTLGLSPPSEREAYYLLTFAGCIATLALAVGAHTSGRAESAILDEVANAS